MMSTKGTRSFRREERKQFHDDLLEILEEHDCTLPPLLPPVYNQPSLSNMKNTSPISTYEVNSQKVERQDSQQDKALLSAVKRSQQEAIEVATSSSMKRKRVIESIHATPVELDMQNDVAEEEGEGEEEDIDLSSLKLAVVIRGELTQRIYKAWELQLPKRLPNNHIALTTDVAIDVKLVVVAAGCSLDSFKTWLGKRVLPSKQVKIVSSDWIISSLKNGQLIDYKPFLLPWNETTLQGSTSIQSNPSLGKSNVWKTSTEGNNVQVKDFKDAGIAVQDAVQPASSSRTREWNKVSKYEQVYACVQTGEIKGINANKYITDILEELQNIYDLTGDEWRSIGYKKCIGMLKQQPRITSVEQLKGLKGVGSSIAEKIQEILETGSLKKLKHFQNDPKIKALIELSNIWGVGEKTASDLIKKGFRSVQDLRKKIEEGNNNILTFQQKVGLKYYEAFQMKIPRSEVEQIRDQVIQVMQQIAPGSICTVCGSYRRGKPQSGDVDILIAPPPDVDELAGDTLPKLIKSLEIAGFLTDHLALPQEYYHLEHTKSSSSTANHVPSAMDSFMSESVEDSDSLQKALKGLPASPTKPVQAKYRSSYMGVCKLFHEGAVHRRIDIKIYPQALIPFAILYFTGSDHFNRSMRLYAKKRGFSLSDKGLTYQEKIRFFPNVPYAIGDQVFCKTEEEIFTYLGLKYKDPTDRNVFDTDHTFTEEEKEQARRKPSLLGSNYDSD